MKEFDFNHQEKDTIAEFLVGEKHATSSKSNAIDVVVVLSNHDVIDQETQEEFVYKINSNHSNIVETIKTLITKRVSNKQGNDILESFFAKQA